MKSLVGWFRRDRSDIPPHGSVYDADFSFDPLAQDFIQDPYPTLEYLREHDPVHRSHSGAYVLSRFDDVAAALADQRLGNAPSRYAVVNSRNRDKYTCASVANNILPFIDPPAHRDRRVQVAKSFFPRLRTTAPDVESIALDYLRRAIEKGRFDIIRDFGTPYSGDVLCRFMGVPCDRLEQLAEYSEWFFYLFSSMPSEAVRSRVDAALDKFRGYFLQLIEEKRRQPGNDWISIIAAEPGQLSDTEIADTCMLVFADGIENIDRVLATAMRLFHEHPGQWQLLVDNPQLGESAANECLRFDTPGQFIGRVAKQDLELHGIPIRSQSAVLLMLGSANRDAQQFDRADEFLIERDNKAMLTFGKGQHACMGMSLVKREVGAALRMIATHYPDLKVDCSALEWEQRIGHRWLKSLYAEAA